MSLLKKQIEHFIYHNNNGAPTNYYPSFRILVPAESTYENGVRSYPMSNEHLFALFWDIHDKSSLSATLLPVNKPFTFEHHFIPGTRTQMHSHEYIELFYIVDGEYRQEIMGKECVFHAGELCIIDKNCLHQEILTGTNATILFLGITNSMLDDVINLEFTTESISSFLNTALKKQKALQQYLHFRPKDNSPEALENTLLLLINELERHDIASPFICQALLLRMFQTLSSDYDFTLKQQQHKKMNWPLFEDITKYMNSHLNTISINCLCEEYHFQADYFNRLLKLHTGFTYTEYLQYLRLKKAEALLLNTDYTIEQITEQIGYKNRGYFYKIFTERHQLTPAQFRKKMSAH